MMLLGANIVGLSRGDILWAVTATGTFTFVVFMMIFWYVHQLTDKVDDLTKAVDFLVKRQKGFDALIQLSEKYHIYKPLLRSLEGIKDVER